EALAVEAGLIQRRRRLILTGGYRHNGPSYNFLHIGAVVQGIRCDPDPEITSKIDVEHDRQGIVEPEQLDNERRATEYLDIKTGELPDQPIIGQAAKPRDKRHQIAEKSRRNQHGNGNVQPFRQFDEDIYE